MACRAALLVCTTLLIQKILVNHDFVLASGSAIRAHLLRQAGYRFEVVPAALDEAAIRLEMAEDSPHDVAATLALLKAQQVARRLGREAVVLGADQLLVFEGEVLGKSADLAELKAQLLRLAGKWHALYSAYQLVDGAGDRLSGGVTVCKLHMRALDAAAIDQYLTAAGDTVLGAVGGYQYEGMGIHLFDIVQAEHTAILGLPMREVVLALRPFVDPLTQGRA